MWSANGQGSAVDDLNGNARKVVNKLQPPSNWIKVVQTRSRMCRNNEQHLVHVQTNYQQDFRGVAARVERRMQVLLQVTNWSTVMQEKRTLKLMNGAVLKHRAHRTRFLPLCLLPKMAGRWYNMGFSPNPPQLKNTMIFKPNFKRTDREKRQTRERGPALNTEIQYQTCR